MTDGDAVGGGQILFEFGSVHVLLATPVADRHLLGAKQFRLHRGVDRRHAAADDNDAAANRQAGEIAGLAQFGNELHRVGDAVGVLAIGT